MRTERSQPLSVQAWREALLFNQSKTQRAGKNARPVRFEIFSYLIFAAASSVSR
jgi:hypothetical protein